MTKLTIHTTVHTDLDHAWEVYTNPDYMTKWNFASNDWYCPSAANDLRIGGKLTSRMEAKDGSAGFDFEGTYTDIDDKKFIAYTMGDGRTVEITFKEGNGETMVTVMFDAEDTFPLEFQKQGWQAILENYKTCAEAE